MKDDKYTKFLVRYNKEMAELKADYEILNKDYKESGLHYQRIEWENAKEIHRLRKALKEIRERIFKGDIFGWTPREILNWVSKRATKALCGEKRNE